MCASLHGSVTAHHDHIVSGVGAGIGQGPLAALISAQLAPLAAHLAQMAAHQAQTAAHLTRLTAMMQNLKARTRNCFAAVDAPLSPLAREALVDPDPTPSAYAVAGVNPGL